MKDYQSQLNDEDVQKVELIISKMNCIPRPTINEFLNYIDEKLVRHYQN